MQRWLSALCALVMVLGTAAAPAQAAGGSGELKIGITQFPSTMHPSIDSMLAREYVLAMARRPLTTYDHDWKLVCMLCTELPTIENGLAVPESTSDGQQGIAVTYRIHPEAAWGDGTPVTTEDVVFTWEVGRHPLSGVANFELYRRILSIDVKDDKTFTLHVDRITFGYNEINDFRLIPAHVERAVFEDDPSQYRNRTTFDAAPDNPGLYYGPYRIVEFVSGSHIALEPNATWYGRAPAFDRIVVRVIENTAAIEANLLSGDIDMISGDLGITVDQSLAFEKRHGARYNIIYKPGLIYEHIDLNLDDSVLEDLRVRRALIHGLDREALSQQLFEGKQPIAHAAVSPLDWIHSEDIRKYDYDPAEAARLLDEAGWSVIEEGIRHNEKGERLTFELGTTAGNRTRELVEQVLQSQWREIGVDIRISNQPARVFFGETVSKRKYPHMAMFAWISAPENVPRTTLHSTMIPSEANGWAGQNSTGYRNPEMDDLIDAIERELNREKRKGLWRHLQTIYTEDLPAIPLYWRANAYILPKWLDGLRPTGHQYTTTLWIEEWTRNDR